MKKLLLAGPFVGSLSHEYSFFAPYIIFLKQNRSDLELAVFTRSERFDFYGQYANYLVPLKLKNDYEKDQIFFKTKSLYSDDYEFLVKQIYSMYSKRFDKIAHIYPNIKDFYYQVRWQFPRNCMSYDFQPRTQNQVVVNNLLKNKIPITIFLPKKMNFIELNDIINKNNLSSKYLFITDRNRSENFYSNVNSLTPVENESSTFGYLIEIIRKSQMVISCKSDITNLSLLMGIPTIIIGNKSRIFNPLNTNVTFCDENKLMSLLTIELSTLIKKKGNFDRI